MCFSITGCIRSNTPPHHTIMSGCVHVDLTHWIPLGRSWVWRISTTVHSSSLHIWELWNLSIPHKHCQRQPSWIFGTFLVLQQLCSYFQNVLKFYKGSLRLSCWGQTFSRSRARSFRQSWRSKGCRRHNGCQSIPLTCVGMLVEFLVAFSSSESWGVHRPHHQHVVHCRIPEYRLLWL